MNIKQELKNSPAILVTVPSQKYNDTVIAITKQLSSYSIRYVTLNKTKASLVASFKANNVSCKDLCFIDGITSTAIGKTESSNHCIFLKKPNDLKGMEKALASDKLEIILFDSLSALLIYEKLDRVAKFVNSLAGKVKPRKIVFVALEGEKENALAKKISMSVKAIKLK